MDLSTYFESLNLVDFTVTLDGVYRYFTPDRIRVLNRIARFHGHSTTGEDLSTANIKLFQVALYHSGTFGGVRDFRTRISRRKFGEISISIQRVEF